MTGLPLLYLSGLPLSRAARDALGGRWGDLGFRSVERTGYGVEASSPRPVPATISPCMPRGATSVRLAARHEVAEAPGNHGRTIF